MSPPTRGARFRIGSMMMAVALIAVALGLWRLAPWLLALLVLPAFIAWARVSLLTHRRDETLRRRGPSFDFMATMAVAFLIEAASIAAGFGTCAVVRGSRGGSSLDAMFAGLIYGWTVGVLVAAALVWLLAGAARRHRRRMRRRTGGDRDRLA